MFVCNNIISVVVVVKYIIIVFAFSKVVVSCINAKIGWILLSVFFDLLRFVKYWNYLKKKRIINKETLDYVDIPILKFESTHNKIK